MAGAATALAGAWCQAAPVIPGLHGKHPLTEAQVGEVLVSELRCAACHDGLNGTGMKAAPDLASAGARLTPGYLQRFIAEPSAAHPGTTMPSMLGALSAAKREEISGAITAYLLSRSDTKGAADPKIEAHTERGHDLFHGVGCIACHSPRDEAGKELAPDGVVSLAHLPGKHLPGALADFLHDPLRVRPSGRMPDMKLSKEEAAALARYLGGEPAVPKPDTVRSTAEQIRAGREAFTEFRCAACHDLDDPGLAASPPAPPLAKLDPARGCLSARPGNAPDFHLNDSQRQAIRKALEAPVTSPPASEEVKVRLTQLNCIACHVRDDFGGVAADRDRFFHSSEEALGNESRIPPPLTMTGAKLRPEWMHKVLYDGESVRSYMRTRMPQFGDAALGGLPGLFAEVDRMEPVDLPPPDRESGPMIRNGAHLLLGDKGLNCIACHNYNGKESPGMKGLDLMTSYQRLQPAWFYHFMQDPGAFRPGIVMPVFWPGGKAAQTEILDGDTELQLRALWHNFSLGRSARDPSGLRSEPSKLVVTDTTRTYRGRSNIAGYRGIAVGFPGGMNYAFNAQNGALSGIWQGEFVSVGWRGQGSGNFNPIGRPVTLAQDVAFLQLADDKAPWPLRPKTSKEQPVNPDPLYPRKHGYAFRGYFLDAESVPTFQYRCGPVAIDDKTVPAGEMILRRTFRCSVPTPEIIWFRALAGKIEAESDTVFTIPGMRLTVAGASAVLRPLGDGEQELLIKFRLPPGESTYTIDYELLR